MEKDIAIKAENISKTFRIPHEKISSLRGAFVNAFKSHGYEEFKALDDVSFEVKKGEFFGIIGRNGSGKSTLLKILAGIYQPDRGSVKVKGLISPFLELGIGFNPELSGRDNVYLNAAVLGLTHKQIDEKFDDIVEFSELRRFIDQKVKNYSSGMQVRLMFSVAIHANREILLMDEVLAVGDTNFQSKCLQEFNKYRNQGKTVILVTHDISTIQTHCDRALLLREGKMMAIGSARDVAEIYTKENIFDFEKKQILDTIPIPDIIIETNGDDNINDRFSYRIGNKKISIGKIYITDSNGMITNKFNIGESASIFFDIENKKSIPKAILGVSIYPGGKKENIFSTEILIDNCKGKIKVIFERLNLNVGTFYISVGLTDKSENWTSPYDLLEKTVKIDVFSNSNKEIKNTSSCNLPFVVSYEN